MESKSEYRMCGCMSPPSTKDCVVSVSTRDGSEHNSERIDATTFHHQLRHVRLSFQLSPPPLAYPVRTHEDPTLSRSAPFTSSNSWLSEAWTIAGLAWRLLAALTLPDADESEGDPGSIRESPDCAGE